MNSYSIDIGDTAVEIYRILVADEILARGVSSMTCSVVKTALTASHQLPRILEVSKLSDRAQAEAKIAA